MVDNIYRQVENYNRDRNCKKESNGNLVTEVNNAFAESLSPR
jgi:hypothetical protein